MVTIMPKGRLVNYVHKRIKPYWQEFYDFVQENIGISLAKYLPLILIWLWISLKALEDLLMHYLFWTYIGLLIVTVIVVGRDVYRKRAYRRYRSYEVLKKDQPSDNEPRT